jgi:general secretion pathway protein J
MKASPHTAPVSRQQARGFTLVELLLAMALMSMLLALAYGGLRASTRATDRGQVILEESGRIRMAHQFVRKQLNQMVPLVFMESEDEQPRTIFEGSADGIRFVGPMPGYLGFGGPQVQELIFVRSEQGKALVLSHALLQGFEEENLYVRPPIVLLDRIERASFQFLALDEENESADWTSDWEYADKLPLAVSLDIEFQQDVFTSWPMLFASVRIDASALNELAGEDGLDQNYSTAVKSLIDKRQKN